MPKNRLFSDDLRRFHPTLLLEGRPNWVFFFPMKYCQTQKCFNENARSERPPGHEVGGKCQKLPEKPCFRRFPASSLGESLRFPDPNDFNAASKSASLPKTPYSQRGEIDRYSSDGPMGGRTDGRTPVYKMGFGNRDSRRYIYAQRVATSSRHQPCRVDLQR